MTLTTRQIHDALDDYTRQAGNADAEVASAQRQLNDARLRAGRVYEVRDALLRLHNVLSASAGGADAAAGADDDEPIGELGTLDGPVDCK